MRGIDTSRGPARESRISCPRLTVGDCGRVAAHGGTCRLRPRGAAWLIGYLRGLAGRGGWLQTCVVDLTGRDQ
jgi:hypothetical protein